MRALAWAIAVVVVGGLVVAELAMDMTARDRLLLYVVFGSMALVTGLVAVAALRWASRLRSLLTSLRIVALAAVVVAGGAVAAAALTMFIEPHDLTLVLVALLLGVGLGGILAVAVAGPLTADLAQLAATAGEVGGGDLSARTEIDRNDELGKAARAFDVMTARLEAAEADKRAADEERRTVIAALSHDLRTPLASLQASIEALQDGIALDPDRYLRGMGTDIDHLGRLVEDLFMLARLDAGSHRIQPEDVDLAELADEAVEAMTSLASSRRVRVAADVDGPVPVRADPAAVGRVMRNLIDNAVRHSPPDSTVTVTVRGTPVAALVEVIDQGPGFPSDTKIFERFVRDDDGARSRGGSGLGLAIAKELIQLSEGRIELAEGAGGRVRFILPVS